LPPHGDGLHGQWCRRISRGKDDLSDKNSQSTLYRSEATPLRRNVDREINATLSTNTEGQSVPLIYKLLVVAVMVAMVAAAMLFVLLVRIG
jgi:hypothetical protein